jgi:hypothetical protein
MFGNNQKLIPNEARAAYKIILTSINDIITTSNATESNHKPYLSSYGHNGKRTPAIINAKII